MDTVQAWLIVGIPSLVLAGGLFAGRSVIRSSFGYLVLVALFVFFLLVPDSPVSAGVVGAVAFLLVATGRGETAVETEDESQGVPLRVDDPNIEHPERL